MTAIINDFLQAANFQQAWNKVRDNKGCAGADEETLDDFADNLQLNLSTLIYSVANNVYSPHPLKQVFIPKNNGKVRELRIPTVRDRIVQQALLNVLVPLIEPTFSDCSFAYRPNLSIIKAVEKIAHWRDLGYRWILDADIVKYFDSIDRQILLLELRQHIDHPGILYLIKAWISSGILTKKGLEIPDKGIPQGAVVSPLLANVYLDKFDRAIINTDLKLVRYADDFLLLGKNRNRILQAYTEVVKLLHTLNLAIHTDKTQITNFEQGFRFLGHGFIGNGIVPLDSPNQKSQSHHNSKKKVQTRKNYQKRKRRYYNRP
jgi:RNA-directed DNA polymerase